MSAKTSVRGRKLIEKWEGLYLSAYQDSVGIWTIGYGSISNPAFGIAVYRGLRIDKATADRWLEVELEEKEAAIQRLVRVPLNQNQFDTLESFAYNCGIGALSKSTLLKLLNKGKYEAVPAELAKYTHGGGKFIQGLANRRRDEIRMWNGDKIDSIPDAPLVRVNPSLIHIDPAHAPRVVQDVLNSKLVKTAAPIVAAAGATVFDQMTVPVLVSGVVGMGLGAYIMYRFDHKG